MVANAGQDRRWRRIRRLFAGALEIEPDARAPWLDDQCRSDPELRRIVGDLVSAAEDDVEVIDMTIQEASRRMLDTVISATTAPAPREIPDRRGVDDPQAQHAFACIGAFFFHAARSRAAGDPLAAVQDLKLARAFQRASAGDTQAMAIVEALLQAADRDDERSPTIEALRHWIDTLRDGDAGTPR